LLGIEFVADQQQYEFQTEKYRRIRMGEPLDAYADGFVHTGLWAKVRHPNYAAEQGMWIIIYLFSVVATGELLNWTIYGVVLLVALFKGSSDFSESISAAKYPRYREYQQTTPRYLPF
jgi:steroid 5-alpha reductase family enzyme